MIKEILKDIFEAIPKIEQEDKLLDNKHGIDRKLGLDPFEEKNIRRIFDENIYEKELEKRLMTYDYDALLKTEALIYYGRDIGSTKYKGKLHYFSKMAEPKEEIVRTILEKVPACKRYIVAAIQKLQHEGLRIEDI
jgi:hypothetical protein